MTQSAGLLRDTQVAGIQEADELGRLVIEPRVRVRRFGGCFPKLFVLRENVRLLFLEAASGIAAVTIGAPEHDVLLRFVHWLDALMTLQTADTFCVRFGLGLIDPIVRRQSRPCDCRSFNRNGGWWAVAGCNLLCNCRTRDAKKDEQKTFNAQRPTFNAQRKRARFHFESGSSSRRPIHSMLDVER